MTMTTITLTKYLYTELTRGGVPKTMVDIVSSINRISKEDPNVHQELNLINPIEFIEADRFNVTHVDSADSLYKLMELESNRERIIYIFKRSGWSANALNTEAHMPGDWFKNWSPAHEEGLHLSISDSGEVIVNGGGLVDKEIMSSLFIKQVESLLRRGLTNPRTEEEVGVEEIVRSVIGSISSSRLH